MKELWQNERSKAGISLGLWGVFIVFLFLLVACGNLKQEEPVLKNEPTSDLNIIETKYSELLSSNFAFKLTIEKSDSTKIRVYDSSFIYGDFDDTTYEGYVEDDSQINRFKCDTKCYNVYFDHEEEEAVYYEELVKNIDYLKSKNFKLAKENDSTYTFKDEEKNIKVYIDENENISKIVIETLENKIIFDINYNKNV